jgi:hypothetical protein
MANDGDIRNPLVLWEQRGREARSRDVPIEDNPLRRAENMPGATGQMYLFWEANVAAWNRGWHDEDERLKLDDTVMLVVARSELTRHSRL